MGAPGEKILIPLEGTSNRIFGTDRVSTRTWAVRAGALLAVLVLVGALILVGIRGLGYWLEVDDPLEHARAVVVLGGHWPFRAMEAASIYQCRWAPEVWVTTAVHSAEEQALNRLGLQVVGADAYERAVLERLGVPAAAIRILNERVRNTVDEIQLVSRELGRINADRVILVTSKAHSRRVRTTWRAVVGDSPRGIVRYASEDPYDPDRWWRRTPDALAVSREVFGLMNVWAGFPVRPAP